MGNLRYEDAGINLDEGNRAVELIKESVATTHTPQVLGGLGNFGGLYAFDPKEYSQPVLVASTDSVGTKVKVAIATGRHQNIGKDLVNHCINDILCCGAKPLFFLDYYATGKLDAEELAEIVQGIAVACKTASCALIGGETAEMPGLYALGDYDIAGFIVGVVEREAIIDGSRVKVGDAVIGLPSFGLHTNGYALVRHIVNQHELSWEAKLPGMEQPLADALLAPHHSYLPAVQQMQSLVDIRALAHITGGGLRDNIPRVLPDGLGVELQRSAWEVPTLFTALQKQGGIREEEMWRTFNMGIGMVAVVPADQAQDISRIDGMQVYKLGTVVQPTSSERVVLR